MAFLPSLICRRLISRSPSVAHNHRMSTAACNSVPKRRKFSVPCPCLMLPPSLNDGTGRIDYNFYSLAENKVVTLPQSKRLNDLMPKSIQDLKICGSSHGWIALFNPLTLDLFIYNPISLRHIKLPPIPNHTKSYVKKLILSSSPEESSCRAVMIYSCVDAVAFCYPGRSNEWTPIGDKGLRKGKGYYDFVYSSRQNLFFGLHHSSLLETWDLNHPSSPRLITYVDIPDEATWFYDDLAVRPGKLHCLVVADGPFYDDQHQVLLVTRYMIAEVAPDGSFIGYDGPSDSFQRLTTDPSVYPIMRKPLGLYPPVREYLDFWFYPYMTIGFSILLYDQEEDQLCPEALGDLSLFIGNCSDSFALLPTQYPQLKSNSIYFTDNRLVEIGWTDKSFRGHDIGIYNWKNQTVSPCYYPCDRPNLKTIQPYTNWFFPSSF